MSESNVKPTENKQRQIHVRCTDEEYLILKNKAKEAGCRNISEYVRNRTLNDGGVILDAKTLVKELNVIGASVGRVGNNINQVVKAINANEKAGNAIKDSHLAELNAFYKEYMMYLKRINKSFKTILKLFRKKQLNY